MQRFVALIVLAIGIALIIYGINASNSLGSDISRFFTGAPTDKAIWFLIGGVALTILGIGGVLHRPSLRG
jgi:hypothetical protein